MECKDLLELIPATEHVSVVRKEGFSIRELACGIVSEVAMELPNCILHKHISHVRIGFSVGGESYIEIGVGEKK